MDPIKRPVLESSCHWHSPLLIWKTTECHYCFTFGVTFLGGFQLIKTRSVHLLLPFWDSVLFWCEEIMCWNSAVITVLCVEVYWGTLSACFIKNTLKWLFSVFNKNQTIRITSWGQRFTYSSRQLQFVLLAFWQNLKTNLFYEHITKA